ncbi:ATP-dependent DNA helicase [Leptothrix discophora]|uniref:ATP-dependent DNA helicase n=1 Tax=Leptothrix discophora TaxID=89 RepID=A0ABT9FYQ2_LEPDI|nr:ATP-dependent DNA helicase [Leptothrix discophora]MDP4299276.1 ATP-dependent DNA helicase [Leptothrix discophora]
MSPPAPGRPEVDLDDGPLHVLAVRALCELVARRGDLDLRNTPAPSAQQGIDGHALIARRRGAQRLTEVGLSARHGALLVRGRADGWDPAARRLEEVKTHRGKLARQNPGQRALHWAQAKVYGWMLCQAEGLDAVELALVYLDVDHDTETVLVEPHTADALRRHFEDLCERALAWVRAEAAHRVARDAAMAALAFPHADFRPGQRRLAETVFKGAKGGRTLLAQAPTGIGKTVGTLFPLLKAMPVAGLDRVFFLTAKTSGRALALDALARLRGADPTAPTPLRVLELVARDKACEHPDKACHGESCPLARGFHDRLPAAREAACALPDWSRETVRRHAASHQVCPYYLAQELARWADVAVGDYNHFFDGSALLHALTQQEEWRVALLVDEAHNLIERARAMYSASLSGEQIRRTRLNAAGEVRKALDKVQRRWKALLVAHALAAPKARAGVAAPALTDKNYLVLDEPPDDLVEALQQAATAVIDRLVDAPDSVDPGLLQFGFDALQWVRLAEVFGPHTLVDLERLPGRRGEAEDIRLTLRNVVPAPHLRPRLAAAHSLTLFSATLQPPDHHRTLLGLGEDSGWLDVAAPFSAEQLAVHVAADVSTRWQHRERSLPRVVARIAAQYRERPGHYLAFFSSFDYLAQVQDALAREHPDLPLRAQRRGMSEPEQAAFLAGFDAGGRGIALAVLGGSFAEGIDLPGDRLIGAFIATLGLPQVNPVNEQMRERLDALVGDGWDATYLYPGLQKVVQAAGRVIRTTQDRGVLHLLDDRYGRPEVRALLPAWWRIDGA